MKLEGNSSRDDDANGILLQPRKGSVVRLQIAPIQQKTITRLPKRPPVDLAFDDLTYTVREGRKNSEYSVDFTLSTISQDRGNDFRLTDLPRSVTKTVKNFSASFRSV